MAEKQTLKTIIKRSLQLINISLIIGLTWLLVEGYRTFQPALEEKAVKDMQKVVVNLRSKQETSMPAGDIDSMDTNNLEAAGHKSLPETFEAQEQVQEKETEKNADGFSAHSSPDIVPSANPEEKQITVPNQIPEQNSEASEKHNEAIQPLQRSDNPYQIQKTKIAILLTNLGLGRGVTEAATQLPKPIALGFSPYTNSLKDLIYQAKENGHEIFLEVPFETEKYPLDDVGPFGILNLSDDGENLSRLQHILSLFPTINGVYSVPNEKFTDNIARMDPILDIFSRNLLLLLYGKGDFSTLLSQSISQKGIPALSCDKYIDLSTEYGLIQQKLEKLEEISKSKGKALGFVSSYPITIAALAEWLKTLENKNIELVPVSEILSSN
ncbi:MAG: hypothetical protein K0Q51_797 [Rickettsiaceae bacterium]|jgi:polysaccharide deacetylase 2 family uncharacterized protein YibQ|nr:hypothetical protein [Rickettsiaceae bacterium]